MIPYTPVYLTYHLTCWLCGGKHCCNKVFPNKSSSSMGLGAAVGPPAAAACGAWTTAGCSTAARTDGANEPGPSGDWGDKQRVQICLTKKCIRRQQWFKMKSVRLSKSVGFCWVFLVCFVKPLHIMLFNEINTVKSHLKIVLRVGVFCYIQS